MGHQQKGARQRGADSSQHQRCGTRFAGEGEPGDDDRRRQKLQHRGRGGIGFFNGHQKGELHG
ncbi:Uncharacterised protein [Klebsiella pneumoniae]|nr:Uncharacterised protein [Klebsiella pneumoniae]